ncbi:MAG: PAS domain-containing protein, partial [Planctomycetota bacterium]
MRKERKNKSGSTPPGVFKIDRRAEMILQTSIDGFCVVGLDGRIIHANPAVSDISGYSNKELLNMKVADLEIIESEEEIAEHIEKIKQQGYDRFITKHRRKNGSIIDVEISTQFCDFGEEKFFFSFFRDITERKRIEQQLQLSEEKYQLLFDSAPIAILLLDPETGQTLDCNSVALEFVGLPKQQFLSSVTAADLSPPFQPDGSPSAQKAEELLAQAFNGESLNFEWTFVRPDGQQRIGSIHLVPVQYKNTKRILLASEDITELNNIEIQLQLSETRYKMLVESAEQVICRVNQKGTFLFLNQFAAQGLGGKPEDLIGKSMWDLFTKKFADKNMSLITKALKSDSH